MLTGLAQPTGLAACSSPCDRGAARVRFAAALAVLACTIAMLAHPAHSLAQGGPSAGAPTGTWPWPVLGEVITPYTNGNDPYAAGQHRGLDIAAPVGEPVLAIVDGRVSYAGRLPDGGLAVTVRSRRGGWLISSLHLSQLSVARGARVRAGVRLGRVGTTGRRSATEAHLHLSVRRATGGAYVDPLGLLGARRLPNAPPATRPRVEALEQPVRRSSLAGDQSNVRAQQLGDNSLATRHGAQRRRVASAGSASEGAHEGHAADGISRVAPPPITMPRDLRMPDSRRQAVRPAAKAPEKARRTSSSSPRPVLLAVAAICLIALALRRRPRGTAPNDAPHPSALATDVIDLAAHRRSA